MQADLQTRLFIDKDSLSPLNMAQEGKAPACYIPARSQPYPSLIPVPRSLRLCSPAWLHPGSAWYPLLTGVAGARTVGHWRAVEKHVAWIRLGSLDSVGLVGSGGPMSL